MSERRSPKAFLELLEPLRDGLYRHARRLAWRADDAADILQEAVTTAWRRYDQFEAGTNFRAWMFKILINTSYRLNKRGNARRTVAWDESHSKATESRQANDAWASVLEDPQRLSELLDDRLAHALDQLPENERQCLLLRLLEDFSYKEIAAALEIPLGTVMSHIHRARLRLRERLTSLGIESGLIRGEPV